MLLSSAARNAYAEAKYGVVVADYPDLRLHSAASKGNIALVQYALSHGQPPNSVLDGVLPIHAAAAGGSELVVSLLLEYGADVNALRLPLKYSQEKNKSGGTIVGTSGCTALHFAAANGHIHIVRLLLSHGADPNKADKHGVKPEDLALELGHVAIADLLKSWNDKIGRSSSSSPTVAPSPPSPTRSRILRVQRSIDNVLSGRKSSHSLPRRPIDDETASQSIPWISGNVVVQEPHTVGEMHLPPRRPSLPTLAERGPRSRPEFKRPNSFCEGTEDRPVPRGTDLADDYPSSSKPTVPISFSTVVHSPSVADSGTLRRLGSKYSLLNIFKKANDSNPSISPSPSSPVVMAKNSIESLGRSDLVYPVVADSSGSSPPKSPSTLHNWYRSPKTEAAVSSPLASESVIGVSRTTCREGDDEPFDSNDDNEKKPWKHSGPFKSIHIRHSSSQSARGLRFVDPPPPPPRSPPFVPIPLSPSVPIEPSPQLVTREITRSNSVASQKSDAQSGSGSSVASKVLPEGEAAKIHDRLGDPVIWDRSGDAKSRSRIIVRAPRADDSGRAPSSMAQSHISTPSVLGLETRASPIPPPKAFEVSGPIPALDSQAPSSLPPVDGGFGIASGASSNKLAQKTVLNTTASIADTPSVSSSLKTNSDLSMVTSSPSSSIRSRPAPLILNSVSTRAEARFLVQKAQEEIIALANHASDSPIPSQSLAEQLEAYGKTLQLERRFARGEAQKDVKINVTSADEPESDDGQDVFVSSSVLGLGSPPPMRQGISAFAANANRLDRAASLGNSRHHYVHSSYHHTPSEDARISRPVVGSLSSPHIPSISGRRRHRPIANMSSLQHKRSLDARLNSLDGLNDDEDVDEFDISGPEYIGVRLAKSRLRSNIEIIRTLPTPTESPVNAASAFRRTDKLSPVSSGSSSTPPPSSPSFDTEATFNVQTVSNPETHVPLSRVSTVLPHVTLGQVQYSTSIQTQSEVKTPFSPSRSLRGLANFTPPSPPRSGNRFGLRNLVQTLTGK